MNVNVYTITHFDCPGCRAPVRFDELPDSVRDRPRWAHRCGWSALITARWSGGFHYDGVEHDKSATSGGKGREE